MKRYFKYLLIAVFMAAVTIIVVLQFNSNQSINQLINGNQDLLETLKIKTELKQLENNILALDAETKTVVINGQVNEAHRLNLSRGFRKIEDSQSLLDSLHADPLIAKAVDDLQEMISQKAALNKEIIDTLALAGKKNAELFIDSRYGNILSDSIRALADQIDLKHELNVTRLITTANDNGRKAKTSGSFLALLAALASLFTFGYISYKMMEQQRLIHQLNKSELKARESATIKENFLANMSHEIRTPLNAILGFTGLLEKKKLDAESGNYVGLIHKAGDNLLHIVNDILDLSKIEAGMLRIESRAFRLADLMQTIESIYKPKALEKKLDFSIRINSSVPDVIEGDPDRLAQVIVNLVVNALKFTRQGGISIDIQKAGGTPDTPLLRFDIRDTGIGIPENELQSVFERFHQAEESASRRYGGTGLGLSIVKDLVHLMNGNVEVESEPGDGTLFKVFLPFKLAAFTTSQAKMPDPSVAVHSSHKKILVVEDNEMNQLMIGHLLSSWKLDFEMVGNGKEAISKLSAHHYHLVLMDIQMPGMDGYTTTSIIRNDLKSDIPVIAMTAHAMPGEKEKCLKMGMNDYIPKPINERELYQLLITFLTLEPQNESAGTIIETGSLQKGKYNYISLGYLESISLGNRQYERVVTEQFIEMVPKELEALHTAWQSGQLADARYIAHNLKTTVSIMGILPLLEEHLNRIELEALTPEMFSPSFDAIKNICDKAVGEAADFLASNV